MLVGGGRIIDGGHWSETDDGPTKSQIGILIDVEI